MDRTTARMMAAASAYASGTVTASDPYIQNVVMLLHGDGSDGAQNNTFVDSSASGLNVTRVGNATQGSFGPYGNLWSNYFDGGDDYLQAGGVALGSSNFTVECWVYVTAGGRISTILRGDNGGDAGVGLDLGITANNQFFLALDGRISGDVAITGNNAMTPNSWQHVAFVRNGSSCAIYVNGSQAATGTLSAAVSTPSFYRIGGNSAQGGVNFSLPGYISNLRVVSGVAVYTSNFTPPTSPLSAISGTALLTCNSNRFRDSSGNALAITQLGGVSVQEFSPFARTTAYSAATDGGAGYFDGTGDYLTVPGGSAAAFGTGDFTVECWAYFSNAASTPFYFFDNRNSGQTTNWALFRNSLNELEWWTGSVVQKTTVTMAATNQWYHLAYTRSGTTGRLFINGALAGTFTDSTNYSVSSTTSYVGARYSLAEHISGYISDLRIVKGTALYTASFTPPTAPLAAVTNTTLLLGFANAGVLDNASMSVLETVDNARIATARKKFGTGSLYFDGTGDQMLSQTSPLFNFGTEDFTVECWAYTLGYSGSQYGRGLISIASADGVNRVLLRHPSTSNRLNLYWGGLNVVYFGPGGGPESTTELSTSTWYHVALTRQSGTFKLWIDGSLEITISGVTQSMSLMNRIMVGASTDGTVPVWNGHIDDVRITRGVARYTSNFTPPQAAFPDL